MNKKKEGLLCVAEVLYFIWEKSSLSLLPFQKERGASRGGGGQKNGVAPPLLGKEKGKNKLERKGGADRRKTFLGLRI